MNRVLSSVNAWFGRLTKRPESLDVAGGLTPGWQSVRLDKVDSVSASEFLIEVDWDDQILNQQYQRFLNGS